MYSGSTEQTQWMREWCQVFKGIFGVAPYFAQNDTTFTKNEEYQNLPVGTITQSGGKSTRRARTKRARRAKRRHTRRGARREYRGR
jgi:hypothetical protein